MTSITSSVSNTLVSALGAVTVTANTATRTVHTIASGMDMLDQYVQDARREQIARSAANETTLLKRIADETSFENAERRHNLARSLSTNPDLAALFAEEFRSFESDVAPVIKAKLDAMAHRQAVA